MRCLLVAIMIVLLPWRGWTGNAMATDMAINTATQQVFKAQASTAAPAAVADVSTMPQDCPMHLQAVADQTEQTDTAGAHCHSCDTCQLCLALGTWTHTVWTAGTMNRPSAPLLMANSFRSADRFARFKPPIS